MLLICGFSILPPELVLGHAIGLQKLPQVGVVADQHDVVKFSCSLVLKARRLLSGADAGAEHRRFSRFVKGGDGLFAVKQA